jgi:hypothetical protein
MSNASYLNKCYMFRNKVLTKINGPNKDEVHGYILTRNFDRWHAVA